MPKKHGRIKCSVCMETKSGMLSMAVHLTIAHKIKGIDLDMVMRKLRDTYG